MINLNLWVMALGTALVVCGGVSASAQTFSGSLSTGDGNLIVGGDWSTASLSWTVSKAGPGLWQYDYTFEHEDPETSHFIVELSPGVEDDDINNLTAYLTELGSFGPSPENPGIPDSFPHSVKFDETDGTTTSISFTINRIPTWGDFYAKGGSDSFAYNSGFADADPLAPLADGPLEGHLLVPDTRIPEPSTVALALLVLSVIFVSRAYRRHTAAL